MKKIQALIRKYWDILSYLFFGGLTTLVNYLVYFPLFNWVGCSATLSNAIAWALSVLFAYLTNKPFVFKSYDWSWKTVGPEFGKFVGCRLGSGLVESLIILVTVDILGLNGNTIKLLTSVLVVLLNYVSSKLVVFKKK